MLNGRDDRIWWSRLTPAERRQEIKRWARRPPEAEGGGVTDAPAPAPPPAVAPEPEPIAWTEQDVQDEIEALDAPPELAELIARARAAGYARSHSCHGLPDPGEHGIPTPERQRRETARNAAYEDALRAERRCLAQAAAQACRTFAEDLLDAWDPVFYRDLMAALEEVVTRRRDG
jgi:hypothetical protein